MKVLISGGAGFLGLNTAAALAERGHDAVITTHRRDDVAARELAGSTPGIVLEMCDLFNEFEVFDLFSRHQFDVVIHTATAHMFAATRAANFPTYRMLFNCLEAATTRDVQRFILSGSVVVYRGMPGPWREHDALPNDLAEAPHSPLDFVPYFEATVKRANELIALDYGLPAKGWDRAMEVSGNAHGPMQVVATRCPTQFGPRYTSMYSPVSNCVHAAVRGGGVPEDRRPRDAFDMVYIRDSADALVALSEAKRLAHRIYNVSSHIRPTAHDLLSTLYAVVPGAEARVGLPIPEQTSLGDGFLDISRLRDDLGWAPKFDLAASIEDYAGWLRDHAF